MADSNSFNFQQERTFKQIFSDAFSFLKIQGKAYYFQIFLYAAPFFAVSGYYSSIAAIKINQTQNLFSAPELLYSFIFEFLAEIMLNGISYAFIILYIQNKEVTRGEIGYFFNQNLKLIIGSTVLTSLLVYSGFILFIVPGIILLPPMSLYVFDKLYNKQPLVVTYVRSMELSRFDRRLSYGVILSLFLGTFLVKQIVGSFVPISSHHFMLFQIIIHVIVSVFCSISSIVISLLYFSLISKITKNPL